MTRVLVGLSGGVDSAVTAYLLKKQGYDVTAGFMVNYTTEDDSCTTKIDLEVAKQVADFLEIPFFTFDFRKEYEKRIVDYIYDGYARGITPNPDVLCNSLVKFDLFLEEAKSLGFEKVATGHYARISENWELLRWVDTNKDQSYFLSGLTWSQLESTLFPIGAYEKKEIRKIAKEVNLPNADRKDSQGICFIGKVGMKEFLAQKIPAKSGNIVDTSGKILGTHEGAWNFTIGQRKGIGIGGGPALFVVGKDIKKNEVIVGTEDEYELYSDRLSVEKIHWIHKELQIPLDCTVKIRYRQEDQKIKISKEKNNFCVKFEKKQRAITPGQIAVFYNEDVCLGNAEIL